MSFVRHLLQLLRRRQRAALPYRPLTRINTP